MTTIVGSQLDGINIANSINSRYGGARLVPRLLSNGGYALDDNCQTDTRFTAAHSTLAAWTTDNSPSYQDLSTAVSAGPERLFVKRGDNLYVHYGPRGVPALSMPHVDVLRFEAGPDTGSPNDLNRSSRRNQLASQAHGSFTKGIVAGESMWVSFCLIHGDTPSISAGIRHQFLQFPGTAPTGFNFPAGVACELTSRNGNVIIETFSSVSLNPDVSRVIHYQAAPPAKGVKVFWVFELTPGATGGLNVWRNSTKVVEYTGPVGYYSGVPNGSLLAWLDFGQYANYSDSVDVVYYANFEWSKTSLASKINNPLPVPDLVW